MSGIYAYAVLPNGVEPPHGLSGHGEEPVECRDLDGICVWYSTAPAAPAPTVGSIRAHNAVADAALRDGVTPLPLRFGQWFADEAEFAGAMKEEASSYGRLLQEVAGCVEYGLTVIEIEEQDTAGAERESNREIPEDPRPGAHAGPGAVHLRELARTRRLENARRDRALEVAAELGGRFNGVVREERVQALPRGGGLVSIAQLVPRTGIVEYQDRVRDVRRRTPTVRLVASGPWPPYSFVQ